MQQISAMSKEVIALVVLCTIEIINNRRITEIGEVKSD